MSARLVAVNDLLPPHPYVPLSEADRKWHAALGANDDLLTMCFQEGDYDGAAGLCSMQPEHEVHAANDARQAAGEMPWQTRPRKANR